MKNIAVISDLSAVGNCSLGVALPILSSMGYNCIPIATSVLSSQTAFANYRCQTIDNIADNIMHASSLVDVDRYIVGFCTGGQQLLDVVGGVDLSKTIIDPIMGDNGKLYHIYDNSYIIAMKKAISGCMLITPNLTEACMLLDVDYDSVVSNSTQSGYLLTVSKMFEDICNRLNVDNCVITSVVMGDVIGNIIYTKGQQPQYVTSQYLGGSYSGTGDTFTSVVVGCIAMGNSLFSSVTTASQFVYNSIAATMDRDPRIGVAYQLILDTLPNSHS